MNTVVSRFIIHTHTPPYGRNFTGVHVHVAISSSTRHRRLRTVAYSEVSDEKMVVVGGGAAGIYGAIRAKTFAPNLNVIVIEKAKPLAKILAEKYPRGSKEFRGSFFNVHGPNDTMSWFSDQGVKLK
ncbi:FAD/NAD(P)-binding oxidoreductase family protein, partial [Tanacetum coccineum]